jgi:hypothetical protein
MKHITILLAVLLAPAAWGQFTNKSSVLDGSGTTSAGGTFTNISAAGQPGGIAESSGGGFINQAGFLNTFFMKPGLDTDGDGLANEADPDNDNDALADASEIGGGAFNPNTVTLVNLRDSDGDGMSDGQESVSGTDPNDPNARLALVSITNAAGNRQVAWLARGDSVKKYAVKTTTNALQPYATVIFSNTVAGGSGPWFPVTNAIADSSVTNVEFYAVEVYP